DALGDAERERNCCTRNGAMSRATRRDRERRDVQRSSMGALYKTFTAWVRSLLFASGHLPNFALDRLSRYEATLWRQPGRILYALETLAKFQIATFPHFRFKTLARSAPPMLTTPISKV